ncbi:MAG: anti-sigma factor, partial [Nocardioides sp.]
RSERLGQAVFVLDDAPAAPEGRTYQMWLFADSGAVVSAGLIESGGDRTVLLDGDAARATDAAISIEPAGGSTQPTTDPVVRIDFSLLESG